MRLPNASRISAAVDDLGVAVALDAVAGEFAREATGDGLAVSARKWDPLAVGASAAGDSVLTVSGADTAGATTVATVLAEFAVDGDFAAFVRFSATSDAPAPAADATVAYVVPLLEAPRTSNDTYTLTCARGDENSTFSCPGDDAVAAACDGRPGAYDIACVASEVPRCASGADDVDEDAACVLLAWSPANATCACNATVGGPPAAYGATSHTMVGYYASAFKDPYASELVEDNPLIVGTLAAMVGACVFAALLGSFVLDPRDAARAKRAAAKAREAPAKTFGASTETENLV